MWCAWKMEHFDWNFWTFFYFWTELFNFWTAGNDIQDSSQETAPPPLRSADQTVHVVLKGYPPTSNNRHWGLHKSHSWSIPEMFRINPGLFRNVQNYRGPRKVKISKSSVWDSKNHSLVLGVSRSCLAISGAESGSRGWWRSGRRPDILRGSKNQV